MENSKRRLLKSALGLGVLSSALPNSWVKPVVNMVVLPAHGQTSQPSPPPPAPPPPTPLVAPMIDGASCSVDTTDAMPGSVISISANISDSDTDIANISWVLNRNGTQISNGTGQFNGFNYTVVEADVGMLTFELVANDGVNTPTSLELCQVTVTAGTPLLHISGVVSNPVGGDCGPDARELVIISNAGNATADINSFAIQRIVGFGTAELLVSLSGTLAPGASLQVDVCQGTTSGTSARLNNTLGGVVGLFDDTNTPVDLVQYAPVDNSVETNAPQVFGPTPDATAPRSS